jgi:hypothetical protein
MREGGLGARRCATSPLPQVGHRTSSHPHALPHSLQGGGGGSALTSGAGAASSMGIMLPAAAVRGYPASGLTRRRVPSSTARRISLAVRLAGK